VADLGGRRFEEMRVIIVEFLDTDIFRLPCQTFASTGPAPRDCPF
jgi:hypothetical protein